MEEQKICGILWKLIPLLGTVGNSVGETLYRGGFTVCEGNCGEVYDPSESNSSTIYEDTGEVAVVAGGNVGTIIQC